MNLFLDTETRSAVPIKHGSAKYAENCEVTLVPWAIDDMDPLVWDLLSGEPIPYDLEAAIEDPSTLFWFQNGDKFDHPVWRHCLPHLHALMPLERRRDTMVQAYSHGLPGGLEAMGEACGIREEAKKLKTGRRYIQLFCKPNAAGGFNGPDTHPEDWAGFKEYARYDIVAMRACHQRMPKWNMGEKQLKLWCLDQRINARGIQMDTVLAEAAVKATETEKKRLAKRTQDLTADEVQAATQRDSMLAHILARHGVELPDMQAATLERRIKDDTLPEELRELLRVRLQSTTTSVAKYSTLLRGVNADGRLRGTMQFRGAARTGRVAHRLYQPGNMPRYTLATIAAWHGIESNALKPAHIRGYIEAGIAALKAGTAEFVFDDIMALCSNTIRSTIIPGPGKKLVVADLSNIEGRMAAWLAGEQWKLDAFAAYDEGVGADLYILAYAKSFNVAPEDVPPKGDERQIGKVEELMFQYGGGVGAWITGAATYGIDLDKMTSQVWDTLPTWARDEAEDFLQWLYQDAHKAKGKEPDDAELAAINARLEARKLKARHLLPERTFIACDAIKRLWRKAHPEISSYWKEIENAVEYCILNPGEVQTCRKLKIKRSGVWLRIGLPSGRELCYPGIGLNVKVTLPDGKTKTIPGISYMGVSQYTKKWERISTYGGKFFENCLGKGTEVLTEFGWIPIEDVRRRTRVWDGVEWVSHMGCVYRGKQFIMSAFNANMTPDHWVLTTEGWRSASSSKGHHRAPCRLPDGYALSREQRAAVFVGSGVLPLWQNDNARGERTTKAEEQRYSSILRVHAQSNHRQKEQDARNVLASRLLGMAFNASPLQQPEPNRVQRLRWAWNHGLQGVARVVREFLARHGADLRSRLDARTREKQSRLLAGELCLGDVQTTSVQHACESLVGHTGRTYDACENGGRIRDRSDDTAVPPGSRMVTRTGTHDASRLPQSDVYDLMDCGPRQRFVVRGSDGLPLIVHNCTQAAACDQLKECQPLIEEAGYEIVLDIHDENICEAPIDRDDLNPEHLGALTCSSLPWNAGLPLAAAGYETTVAYRKE